MGGVREQFVKDIWIKIKLYVNEIQKNKKYIDVFNYAKVLLQFPSWYQSITTNFNRISEDRPWITFSAIEYLNKYLHNNMKVFEYGSGGSTLFMAQRVREGISVENDFKWFIRINNELKQRKYSNWRIHLIMPVLIPNCQDLEPSRPENYTSRSESYKGFSFEEYVKIIDLFPDEYFNVILIDGRSRPACVKHAISKVSPGGILILDNAERFHYGNALKLLIHSKLWIRHDFFGPGPYNSYFWSTSIWERIS